MGPGEILTSYIWLRLNSLTRLQVAANLVEPGENALVLHSGYFGDAFADWYA